MSRHRISRLRSTLTALCVALVAISAAASAADDRELAVVSFGLFGTIVPSG